MTDSKFAECCYINFWALLLFLSKTDLSSQKCPRCIRKQGKCRLDHYHIQSYMSQGVTDIINFWKTENRYIHLFNLYLKTGFGSHSISLHGLLDWMSWNAISFPNTTDIFDPNGRIHNIVYAMLKYHDLISKKYGSILNFVNKISNTRNSFVEIIMYPRTDEIWQCEHEIVKSLLESNFSLQRI